MKKGRTLARTNRLLDDLRIRVDELEQEQGRLLELINSIAVIPKRRNFGKEP